LTHANEVGMRWDDVLVEVNQQKGETSAITRPHSDASAVRILRQCCPYALEEMTRMWR
jgi:hypothetical protein